MSEGEDANEGTVIGATYTAPEDDLFVLAAAQEYHIGWLDVTKEQRKGAKNDLLLRLYQENASEETDRR